MIRDASETDKILLGMLDNESMPEEIWCQEPHYDDDELGCVHGYWTTLKGDGEQYTLTSTITAKTKAAEKMEKVSVEKAYENALTLARKTNSSVSFKYDDITYTVKPHRLGKKVHELTQECEKLNAKLKEYEEIK
jgi:transcriptional antiterminator Rof (Rho-off)